MLSILSAMPPPVDPGLPLVRAEGKLFVEGYPRLGPAEFIRETPLQRESRSANARAAETAFGFEPSLYFYVGWSHPSFGDAVLLYEPHSFDRDHGGATPFDTGGFFLGFIKVPAVETLEAKRTYVDRHHVALSEWRNQFAAYISKHFDLIREYVQGIKPKTDDGTYRLRDATDPRAWTWELRLYRDHPVMEHLRTAYLSYDYAEALRQDLHSSDPAAVALWYGRFQGGILCSVDVGQCPHRVALGQIAEACS